MLKSSGILTVEPNKGRIVINISNDFINYYKQFIIKEYWIKLQTPLHGSHITLSIDKLHKNIKWDKAIYHHGNKIEFEYDPYIIRGGFKKGFIMFYLRVYSKEMENFKKKFNIVENSNYRGLHITIGNAGKSGSSIVNYWPQMIEIR